MNTTTSTVMGDRGRLVLPAEVRRRSGLHAGTTLMVVESDDGIVLMTREQLKRRVQRAHSGTSLIDELLAERRATARAEDDGTA